MGISRSADGENRARKPGRSCKRHKVIQRFLSWVALCPPLLDAQVKPKADTEPIKNMWPERQVNNPAEADPDTDPYDVDMESESILRPLKKLKGIEQTGNTGQETAMSKF